MPRTVPLIGFLPPDGDHMDYVRVYSYLDHAQELTLARSVAMDPSDFLSGLDVNGYDAVVMRCNNMRDPAVQRVIDDLLLRGVRLVLDLDEDPFGSPVQGTVVSARTARASRTVRRTLGRASAVLVPSNSLARKVSAEAQSTPVHVVTTRLDRVAWTAPSQRTDTIASPDAPRPLVISPRGRPEDLELIGDLPALLSSAIDAHVVIDVVGMPEGTVPHGFRRVGPPSLRYRALGKWMAGQSGRWTVGLVPAAPESALDASHEVAILEHAALGLPVVASNTIDPALLHDGVSLTGGETADWVHSVSAVHDGARKASELGRRALESRRLDSAAVAHWVSLVTAVASAERPSVSTPTVEAKPSSGAAAVEHQRRLAVMSYRRSHDTTPAIVRATVERTAAAVHRMIVVAEPDDANALPPLPPNVTVIGSPGRGGMFYAYKMGLEAAWRHGEFEQVLLINDSFIGPVVPVADILDFATGSGLDVMGLSHWDGLEFHAEPYFLAIQRRALTSVQFWEFWEDMMPVANAPVAYAMYAIGFTRAMRTAGLSVGSYFEPTDDERELAGARAALVTQGAPWAASPTTALADRILLGKRLPVLALRVARDQQGLDTRALLARCAEEFPEVADALAELERAGLGSAGAVSAARAHTTDVDYGMDAAFS